MDHIQNTLHGMMDHESRVHNVMETECKSQYQIPSEQEKEVFPSHSVDHSNQNIQIES